MVDDYLLEKLTEYIILCNGDEERIFVGMYISNDTRSGYKYKCL